MPNESVFDLDEVTSKTVSTKIKEMLATLDNPTAETMAKGTYEVLKKLAVDWGQSPSEVFIRAPGEPRHFKDESCWCVAWEAGPYEWAIPVSMIYPKIVEPYYSFDLCFYPSED